MSEFAIYLQAEATSLSFVFIIFGTLATVNGVVVRFLPETRGREIPDTIDDMKNFSWKQPKDAQDENGKSSGDLKKPLKK